MIFNLQLVDLLMKGPRHILRQEIISKLCIIDICAPLSGNVEYYHTWISLPGISHMNYSVKDYITIKNRQL